MAWATLFSGISPEWWYEFKAQFPEWAFDTPEETSGSSLVKQRFAASFGEGFISATVLDDDCALLFWKFRLNGEIAIDYPIITESDTLVMPVFQAHKPIQINLDRSVQQQSGVYLAENRHGYSSTYNADTLVIKCILVCSTRWLALNIPDEATRTNLNAVISKGAIYHPLSAVYRSHLQQIQISIEAIPFGVLQLKSDVYSLLATFLKNLTDERPFSVINADDINKADLEVLRIVEKRLTADLTTRPPTTAELARESGMSQSKLKRLFQHLFGTGIYEHFQACRLSKARDLILSRQMTVSQAGQYLSYKNLSNFSLAFRKAFGYLPSEVLKPNVGRK